MELTKEMMDKLANDFVEYLPMWTKVSDEMGKLKEYSLELYEDLFNAGMISGSGERTIQFLFGIVFKTLEERQNLVTQAISCLKGEGGDADALLEKLGWNLDEEKRLSEKADEEFTGMVPMHLMSNEGLQMIQIGDDLCRFLKKDQMAARALVDAWIAAVQPESCE